MSGYPCLVALDYPATSLLEPCFPVRLERRFPAPAWNLAGGLVGCGHGGYRPFARPPRPCAARSVLEGSQPTRHAWERRATQPCIPRDRPSLICEPAWSSCLIPRGSSG